MLELDVMVLHLVQTFYQTAAFLGLSKSRALADDKITVTQQLKFDVERVQDIVGKGENAGIQDFLLFSQYIQHFVVKEHYCSHISIVVCNWFQFQHLNIFVFCNIKNLKKQLQ